MRMIFMVLFIFLGGNTYSQKLYRTTGGELILSRTVNDHSFSDSESRIRISAFFHYNENYHYNFSGKFGAFTGFSVSNIGFIYKNQDTTFKRRAYTLGIPVALKIGNLNKDNYLFAGGELEIPFHYKQKKIVGKDKNKYSSFFDDRVNTLIPSLFAGIQFSEGLCFKFRLHLKDFLNKDFRGTDFGERINYGNIDSRLFLISVSYNLKKTQTSKKVNNNERFANLSI